MRGDLHPILAVPAFLLAGALSAPVFEVIKAKAGHTDGPGLLLPYVCCAFLPAALLTFGVAAAIQSVFERAGERVVEHALEAAGGPPARRRPLFVLPFALSRTHVIYLCAATLLACIAFSAWPGKLTPRPTPPTAAEPTDPAVRAGAAARAAIVARLSQAGMDGIVFDAPRRVSVRGRPVWRVTTRGGLREYVIDVGDGTRTDGWGRPGPEVDVYDAGTAPLEDVEAPGEPAAVTSG